MKEEYITIFVTTFTVLNGKQGFVIAIPSFRLKFSLDQKYQVKDMITFSSKSVTGTPERIFIRPVNIKAFKLVTKGGCL